jgi:plasmid stabilization system protein ParE
MMIRFLEPAQIELDDAFTWYETEQKGLGRFFVKEVQHALRRISVFPESCQCIVPGLRRCLTRRFPYMVVYGVEAGAIIIVAIAHMHREPLYWQNRLV